MQIVLTSSLYSDTHCISMDVVLQNYNLPLYVRKRTHGYTSSQKNVRIPTNESPDLRSRS
jgi:hypothetical protein